MTKTKLYLWVLLLLFFGIFNSCRNDHLQDLQVRNNEQNAKLTSKIISLSESPHKARLITELSQTKSLMSKTSSNALGKSVNYGDSISINTEHVIFMQNGNYHNYIFSIEKSSHVPGDPYDNLLLSPLPDGNYKEFLIQYYITEQQKLLYSNGNWTIPNNKIKVTELLPGTYNNGQLVQTMSQNCVWTTVLFGYLSCSENQHFNGEGSGSCNAPNMTQPNGSQGFLSQAVYGSYWQCTEVPQDESYAPSDPPSDEGGGSSGSGGNCSTCPTTPTPCVQVPTDPNQPSTGIGDNGCEFVDPFIPNLPNPKSTPCEKIKKIGKNEVTKNAMKHLKTPAVLNDNKEHAYLLWEDNFGDLHDDIYGFGPENSAGVRMQFSAGDKFSAFLHSHYQGTEMLSTFSFDDFKTFCELIYYGAIKDEDSFVFGVVTAHGTQYMMVIDDPTKLANFASQFFTNGKWDDKKSDIFKRFFNNSVQKDKSIDGNEKGLVNFLELQNIGLKLMKGDDQMENWQLLTKDANNNFTTINCN